MSKSSETSEKYRDKGKYSHYMRDFFGALIFYNKALAYAVTNDDLSLAYANRSATFIELRKYDECLQNIQWARKNQYSKSKLKKLKIREENCKKLKEEDKTEVPESFFKLSYPPNPKIPFIVENLVMKTTNEFGRGIYATTDLKPGDIIALEKPEFFYLTDEDDANYKHCCFCLSICQMNLIPCTKTAAVMFCSEECRNKTYQCINDPVDMIVPGSQSFFNNDTFISFLKRSYNNDDVIDFVTGYESTSFKKTIFDFDFSNPNDENYRKNLLDCILALNSGKSSNDKIGVRRYLEHISGVLALNGQQMCCREKNSLTKYREHLSAILTFVSLINHSCIPNLYGVMAGDKMAIVVFKPIKANEQLFCCYGKSFVSNPDVADRRDKLMKKYNFVCQCAACINNYNFDTLTVIDPDPKSKLSIILRPQTLSYEEAVKEMMENNKIIMDHSDNIFTCENYILLGRNMTLLCLLSDLETFPFKQSPDDNIEISSSNSCCNIT